MIETLRGKLIVSCQAGPDEPLHGSVYMVAMARAALLGGAGGIRANGAADIAAIRQAVSLPIIGIQKRRVDGFEVFITPTFTDAQAVVAAGAHLVALDGTDRPRPGDLPLPTLIERIHTELRVPVMADLSCLDDGYAARDAGADILATTLSGYTAHGRPPSDGPDLDLIDDLLRLNLPVIAEGRFHEPAQVVQAFERGALAVVVGGAITRPQEITRRFVNAIQRKNESAHADQP